MSCFFPLFFRRRMTTATTKVFWTNWNWKKRMKTSSLLWSNRSTVAARTAMSWKSWDSARTSWHKGISTSNDGNSSCGYIAFFFLLPLKRADWHFRSRQSCGNGSRWNWRCDPSCWSPIPTATSIIWMRWCRWLAKSTTRSSRHSSVRCIIDLQVEIPERSGRDCRQDKKKRRRRVCTRVRNPVAVSRHRHLDPKNTFGRLGVVIVSRTKTTTKWGGKQKESEWKKKKFLLFVAFPRLFTCSVGDVVVFCFFSTTERRSSSKIFKFKFNAELVFTIIMMMISSLPWGSLWLRGVASSSSPLRNTMKSRHNKPPHFPSRSCPGRPDVSHPLGIPP